MTREDAFKEMKKGNKITHSYFSDEEFYEMKDGKIIAEDGVDHTSVFWSDKHATWRQNGWVIKEEVKK